ncbi:hypothetical protein N5C67_25335, partial [Comamonas thiooxydans]|uniref:hypothetical protein n=1 Tax=Comamonas thiooxydans TaxID=363952 RepID=UPI002447CF0E
MTASVIRRFSDLLVMLETLHVAGYSVMFHQYGDLESLNKILVWYALLVLYAVCNWSHVSIFAQGSVSLVFWQTIRLIAAFSAFHIAAMPSQGVASVGAFDWVLIGISFLGSSSACWL